MTRSVVTRVHVTSNLTSTRCKSRNPPMHDTSHRPKMIRDGKAAGWLHLPVTVFTQWAELHDVTSRKTISIGTIPGHDHRGSTILASADIDAPADLSTVLMTIPRDLILSLDRIHEHAKCDQDFRLLLDALGDFGKVSHVIPAFAKSGRLTHSARCRVAQS